LELYVLLRSLRRTKPELRVCLKRCKHCGIFFPAHSLHAARRDLGCIFGCRAAHYRKESIRRSSEFYKGEAGRILKGYQNAARRNGKSVLIGDAGKSSRETRTSECAGAPPAAEPAAAAATASESPQSSPCPAFIAEALPRAADPDLIEDVRVVLSLIEGRPVSVEEIWVMLARVLSQRSIGARRKVDHTIAWLNDQPP
jgi:hypothetical protein